MALLDIKNVSYFYQDGDTKRYILKDISCEFEKGKFYTILGESGSGKTTFLSLITALDEPKTGVVIYNGEDIKKIGHDKYRRNKIGIVFQEYNLIQYMTALENILVAMDITENSLPNKKEEIALNLLDYMGIDRSKTNRPVNKLSGGERQRVAIARALATNVDLIVADEPTGNLDEDMEEEIVEIFKKLAHEHKKCLIVVTHSKEIADKSDQTIRLRKGKFSIDE
ncbi:MAG: ABC transporter ATP-binding protein [Oscillospiraceae bacterium]|nr:ABC transporter ATP-binding protein [Oscillospiraceae bacterium]